MSSATTERTASPAAVVAIGVFLIFGACMAGLAGATLVWRGTTLDRIWALNPTAYGRLAPLGAAVGSLFLLLSATMAVAALGWFKHRLWGWRLTVGIISIQAAGDFVSFVRGDFLRGSTGLTIASALLFYLLRPGVRNAFQQPANAERWGSRKQ